MAPRKTVRKTRSATGKRKAKRTTRAKTPRRTAKKTGGRKYTSALRLPGRTSKKKAPTKKKKVIKTVVGVAKHIAKAIKTVQPITESLIPIVEKAVRGTPYALAVGTGLEVLKLLSHTDIAKKAIMLLIQGTKVVKDSLKTDKDVEMAIKKSVRSADDVVFDMDIERPQLVRYGRYKMNDQGRFNKRVGKGNLTQDRKRMRMI